MGLCRMVLWTVTVHVFFSSDQIRFMLGGWDVCGVLRHDRPFSNPGFTRIGLACLDCVSNYWLWRGGAKNKAVDASCQHFKENSQTIFISMQTIFIPLAVMIPFSFVPMLRLDPINYASRSKQLRVVSGNHMTIHSILLILCDSVGIGSPWLITRHGNIHTFAEVFSQFQHVSTIFSILSNLVGTLRFVAWGSTKTVWLEVPGVTGLCTPTHLFVSFGRQDLRGANMGQRLRLSGVFGVLVVSEPRECIPGNVLSG